MKKKLITKTTNKKITKYPKDWVIDSTIINTPLGLKKVGINQLNEKQVLDKLNKVDNFYQNDTLARSAFTNQLNNIRSTSNLPSKEIPDGNRVPPSRARSFSDGREKEFFIDENKKPIKKLANGGIVNPYEGYNKQGINGQPQPSYMNSGDYNTSTSTYEGAAAGLKSAPGIVGAVGSIIGVGDAIGKPIREKTERMDETGQFINEGKVKTGYKVGTVFNPAKSASYWSSKNQWGKAALSAIGFGGAFAGKYAKQREKDEAAKIAEDARLLKIDKDNARIGFDMNRAQTNVSTQPTALYAKGTENMGINGNIGIKDNSKLKRIGNGFEIDAQKDGKDTVPMQVGNQSVMVDNKEILLPRGDGGMAVVSDDNGEATKYRKEIATGRNPNFVASKYIARAGMLKNKNTTTKLAHGTGRIASTLDYMDNMMLSNNLQSYGNTNANRVPFNLDGSMGNVDASGNSLGSEITLPTVDKTFRDASGVNMKREKVTLKDDKKKNTWATKENLGKGIDIAGAAITAFSNQQAMNKLMNIPKPNLTLNPYSSMDVDANKAIFDNMRTETLSQQAGVDKGIMDNTANSNTALAMKSMNKVGTIENLSKIGANQIGNRGEIGNANVQGMNRYSEFASAAKTDFDRGRYQDEVNLINTQLGLNAATQASIQGVRQVGMVKEYDKERLGILANTYGVDVSSPESIKNSSIENLKRMLEDPNITKSEADKINAELITRKI